MLRWRLILGAVFIAALVGLVLLDVWAAVETTLPPGLVLLPLALTITGAATREFTNFVKTREPEFDGGLLWPGNWLIVASPWLGACVGGRDMAGRWQMSTFVGVVLLTFLREILRYDKDASRRVTERLALSVLGLTYVGLLMSFVVRLRLSAHGIWPLVSLLLVVKLSDIGAYTVGRIAGRHKLAPLLSPGKTIEGLGGGLLCAVVGMLLLAWNLGWLVPMSVTALANATPAQVSDRINAFWINSIVFAVGVAVVGVVGDLAESLLKRDFGVKDSSTWMPGFGGVLDLIDSPLFAAPVAWAFWEFGWLVT
jgi:phosphatidate cytidylyltransferase